jgi:hypothetical protein
LTKDEDLMAESGLAVQAAIDKVDRIVKGREPDLSNAVLFFLGNNSGVYATNRLATYLEVEEEPLMPLLNHLAEQGLIGIGRYGDGTPIGGRISSTEMRRWGTTFPLETCSGSLKKGEVGVAFNNDVKPYLENGMPFGSYSWKRERVNFDKIVKVLTAAQNDFDLRYEKEITPDLELLRNQGEITEREIERLQEEEQKRIREALKVSREWQGLPSFASYKDSTRSDSYDVRHFHLRGQFASIDDAMIEDPDEVIAGEKNPVRRDMMSPAVYFTMKIKKEKRERTATIEVPNIRYSAAARGEGLKRQLELTRKTDDLLAMIDEQLR